MVSNESEITNYEYLHEASKPYLEYNYPLFTQGEKMEPVHVGTFVLFNVGGSSYLITASHAAIECSERGFHCLIDSRIISFTGTLRRTKGDNLDFNDIAILKIDDKSNVAGLNIISENMIFNGVIPDGATCSVMGFPVNKVKIDKVNGVIESKNYVYYSQRCDTGIYNKIGLSMEKNIAIHFDQRTCFTHDNVKSAFPKPTGMSGGSMWYYDFASERVFLVGIAIACKPKNKCIYGTRASLICSNIKRLF